MANLADEQLVVLRGLADAAERNDYAQVERARREEHDAQQGVRLVASKLGATDCA